MTIFTKIQEHIKAQGRDWFFNDEHIYKISIDEEGAFKSLEKKTFTDKKFLDHGNFDEVFTEGLETLDLTEALGLLYKKSTIQRVEVPFIIEKNGEYSVLWGNVVKGAKYSAGTLYSDNPELSVEKLVDHIEATFTGASGSEKIITYAPQAIEDFTEHMDIKFKAQEKEKEAKKLQCQIIYHSKYLKDLDEKSGEYQDVIITKEQIVRDKESTLTNFININEQLKLDKAKLEQAILTLKGKLAEEEKCVASHTESVEKYKLEIEAAKERLVKINTEIEILDKEFTARKEEKAKLIITIAKLENDLALIQEELATCKAHREKLANEITALEAKIKAAQSNLDALIAQYQNIEKLLADAREDLVETNDLKRIENAEKTILEHTQTLATIKELEAKIVAEIETYKSTITDLNSQIDIKNEEITKVTAEGDAIKKMIESIKAETIVVNEKLAELTKQCNALKEEEIKLSDQLTKLLSDENIANEKYIKTKTDLNLINIEIDGFNTKITELNEKYNSVKLALAECHAGAQVDEIKVADLTKELEAITIKINEYYTKIANLQEDLNNLNLDTEDPSQWEQDHQYTEEEMAEHACCKDQQLEYEERKVQLDGEVIDPDPVV